MMIALVLSTAFKSRLCLGSSRAVAPDLIPRNRALWHRPAATMAGTHPGHDGRKPNRLAQEQSPYLLQHAYNPVNWLPWGEEAFQLAKERDVPLFLSVGYSTCHWCHVMERESFESEEVAALLNELFVPVKVDKEERPDVDKIYMTYVQATQGGGGWPMSVFLTPELAPIFGGTYFPPSDAFGRPGFKTVLRRISEVWAQQKDALRANGEDALRQLGELSAPQAASAGLPAAAQANAIQACAGQLARRYDAKLGGFGGAPKFPRPSELLLMFCHAQRLAAEGQAEEARHVMHMATFTLDRMAAGGMRDHLGAGFHRYSVDEYWHVPHFEVMLYDAPQLVQAYLQAFQLTGNTQYALIARGVLDYLLRDLRHPGGAFFAAEDADSLDPSDGTKKEGHFYVWTAAEIDAVLGPELSPLFKSHYNVQATGNCSLSPRSDPHHDFTHKNVLIELQGIEATAQQAQRSVGETQELLARCRETLFATRAQRPRPHRDEKVVAAWNGMAIGALALAGRILAAEDPPVERLFPVEGRPPREYIAAAQAAAAFVREMLYDEETHRLRRAFTTAASPVAAFSDDYAQMISGLLDLHAVTGEVGHLRWAMDLQQTLDALFWDEAGGGYFQGPGGDPSIKLRLKEDYDGAEVAASSVAVANLWRLAGLADTETETLRERAQTCAAAFSGRLEEQALALPQMCCSLHLLTLGHPRQVVIAGQRGGDDTEALLDAAFQPYAPDKVVILLDLGDEELMQWWRGHNPEAVALAEATGIAVGDQATAFVCQNFTCKAPTTEAGKVAQMLREPRAPPGGRPRTVPVVMPFK